MDLQEVGCGGMDWIKLAHDRDRWWALANEIASVDFDVADEVLMYILNLPHSFIHSFILYSAL
jgi:hypothetical protein